jgi:hypothetical protein
MTYKVVISRSYFGFEWPKRYTVTIYNDQGESEKYDYAYTKWGAKRLAQKMVNKLNHTSTKPKIIREYELEVLSKG